MDPHTYWAETLMALVVLVAEAEAEARAFDLRQGPQQMPGPVLLVLVFVLVLVLLTALLLPALLLPAPPHTPPYTPHRMPRRAQLCGIGEGVPLRRALRLVKTVPGACIVNVHCDETQCYAREHCTPFAAAAFFQDRKSFPWCFLRRTIPSPHVHTMHGS